MDTALGEDFFLKDLDGDGGFDWHNNKLPTTSTTPSSSIQPTIQQGLNPQHADFTQGSDVYRGEPSVMHGRRITPQAAPPAQTPLGGQVLQCLTSELASLRQSVNELKSRSNEITQNNPTYHARRAVLLQSALTQLTNSGLIQDGTATRSQPSSLFNQRGQTPTIPATSTQSIGYLGGISTQPFDPLLNLKPADVEVTSALALSSANADLQTKKLVRKQRNREAAQNSRMRKKLRMETLEANLASAMEENRKYQIACAELTRRNQELERRLQASSCDMCGKSTLVADRPPVEETAKMLCTSEEVPTSEPVAEPAPEPVAEPAADGLIADGVLPHVLCGDDVVDLQDHLHHLSREPELINFGRRCLIHVRCPHVIAPILHTVDAHPRVILFLLHCFYF